MTAAATITTKGRITVPLQVRRALRVRAGDRLVFKEEGGEVTVTAMHKESPFANYRGIGNLGIDSGKRAIIKKLQELRGE